MANRRFDWHTPLWRKLSLGREIDPCNVRGASGKLGMVTECVL